MNKKYILQKQNCTEKVGEKIIISQKYFMRSQPREEQ